MLPAFYPDTRRVGKASMKKHQGKLHIQLPEDDALRLLLKVKPTADMPRQLSKPEKAKENKSAAGTSRAGGLKHPGAIKGEPLKQGTPAGDESFKLHGPTKPC